jgi:hypothetical protein
VSSKLLYNSDARGQLHRIKAEKNPSAGSDSRQLRGFSFKRDGWIIIKTARATCKNLKTNEAKTFTFSLSMKQKPMKQKLSLFHVSFDHLDGQISGQISPAEISRTES